MSITVLDRLKKRRHYAVPGFEGVFVRSATRGELRRAEELVGTGHSDDFVFGCILMDESGKPVFSQLENESDLNYAERVGEAAKDIDQQTRSAVNAASAKVNTTPPTEDVIKN
jgi:hypothetical protein